MSTGSKIRQQNGPEDFLIASYSHQYDAITLKEVCKLLGLKKSIEMIKHCQSRMQVEHQKLERDPLLFVKEEKVIIYCNILDLKNSILMQYRTKAGIIRFSGAIDGHLLQYQKPTSELRSRHQRLETALFMPRRYLRHYDVAASGRASSSPPCMVYQKARRSCQ